MSKTILNHLMARPMSSILKKTQSENEVTLKLMCIIDHWLEKSQLYADILQYPKLLEQLLRFKNYERFQYFEYKMNKKPFGQLLLACQCCEFVAPYNITMEHMVLNHGRHRSAGECQWCCQLKIHEHIESDTLEQCYHEYIDKYQINVNPRVCKLIDAVFMQLRLLADNLGVRTTRSSEYRAHNSIRTEIIALDDSDDDDLCNKVLVSKPWVRNKMMKSDRLNKLFQEAMRYFDNDKKQIRYMRDQSVAQMPRMQHMQELPQHIQLQQQQQQQPSSSRLSPPLNHMPPMPSHTNIISPDITNLANFMIHALQSMHNDSIQMKAMFNIKKTILQYSAEDLQSQLDNRNNHQ